MKQRKIDNRINVFMKMQLNNNNNSNKEILLEKQLVFFTGKNNVCETHKLCHFLGNKIAIKKKGGGLKNTITN